MSMKHAPNESMSFSLGPGWWVFMLNPHDCPWWNCQISYGNAAKVETVFHPRPIGCHKPWLYLLPSDMLLGMALFLLQSSWFNGFVDRNVQKEATSKILWRWDIVSWARHGQVFCSILTNSSWESVHPQFACDISMKIHPQVANLRPLGVGWLIFRRTREIWGSWAFQYRSSFKAWLQPIGSLAVD